MKMNKHFTKKLLSIVLCLALVLSYLPVNIFAAENKTINVSEFTGDGSDNIISLVIASDGYTMNGNPYQYQGTYTLTGETNYGVKFEAGEYWVTVKDLLKEYRHRFAHKKTPPRKIFPLWCFRGL